MKSVLRSVNRRLPHGPLDLARQIALFWVAYYAYSLVRGLADDPGVAAAAFDNAREIISLERTLHIFVEPAVQTWSMGSGVLIDSASWVYINAQTSVTLGALAWIYLFRNQSFYFVRNMFMAAMVVALVGYTLYPTAPPRFFPEWGFFDSVSDFTGVEPSTTGVNAMFNPYAAVPSMHVAFALMIGWPLAKLVRGRVARAFWWAYPVLVTYVIVATGNHFVMDAVLGAATAGVSALAARELARARPAVWRFGPRAAVSSS
ncbi:MAG TPA: phosphatase PAP2 family protein [Solirubrobacteraceae bacterium]|nr:phosphatase PAP2 family protein [Solirubrobacteraceae bacterium]